MQLLERRFVGEIVCISPMVLSDDIVEIPRSKLFKLLKTNYLISHKLMKTNDELNSTLWRAYPDSKVDLWDQNFVHEYVIAYEISPGLHPNIKSMLPEVSF